MTTEKSNTKWLSDMLKEERLLKDLCEAKGIEYEELWGYIPCPLIGFHGHQASFMDAVNGDGHIVLKVFGIPEGEKHVWSLQEVWANLESDGRIKQLHTNKGLMGVWLSRMLASLGWINLPALNAKPLPEDSPQALKAVYDGLVLAIQCHLVADRSNLTTTYSCRFAADWVKVSQGTAARWTSWLVKEGYIAVEEDRIGDANVYRIA